MKLRRSWRFCYSICEHVYVDSYTYVYIPWRPNQAGIVNMWNYRRQILVTVRAWVNNVLATAYRACRHYWHIIYTATDIMIAVHILLNDGRVRSTILRPSVVSQSYSYDEIVLRRRGMQNCTRQWIIVINSLWLLLFHYAFIFYGTWERNWIENKLVSV